MSRAYCLTCNEQVVETPSGTCPLGHPVTAHEQGPEPWVGYAGDEEDAHTWPAPAPAPAPAAASAVPLERLDTDGRPLTPTSASNGHRHAHTNGHVASLGGGQGDSDPFPSTFGHRSSFTSSDDGSARAERAPAAGKAADDLAALLAEALDAHPDSAPADVADDAVVRPVEAVEDTPTTEDDWGDLASLAAELRLDGDHRTDDGPAAVPDADAPHGDLDAAPSVTPDGAGELGAQDVDTWLEELTGRPGADEDLPAWLAAPPPAPDEAEAPQVASEPAPPTPDAATPPPPPSDDVPSLPPAPEAEVGPDELAPPAPEPPAVAVDLTNFTARGKRVGEGGPTGRPRKPKKPKTKRGRKR